MGTVWEGVHETLGTRVAVKLIELEHVQSPDSLRRFENEAHAAARLQSKHVVEVYDHGVMADGRAFIVMQYLQGEPLERRLDRLGRMSPIETARIVMQICRGLSKAHAIGIVHRDLKPENIFLVWDEEDGADIVKVVDFGIAKFTAARTPETEASGTYTGSLLGTPFYMSPEQARGLKTVDHRSDLWAVGVITYRCMLGKLPFEGESVGDVLVKLCTGPIPVPTEVVPGLPPGFDAFITRALSRDLEVRFASAAELAEALAQVCGLPMRPVYSTGDVPIRNSDAGSSPSPIITPSYPNEPFPADPTLASPSVSKPRAGPEVSIGGGVTNTSPRITSRTKTSVLVTFVFGFVALALLSVFLVKSRSLATGAAVDQPLPQTPAPSAAPTPPEPVPFPSIFNTPPAASASAPVEADQQPPAAASASAAPSALPRQPSKNPKRPPAAASSSRPPNLDIRLER
jgi:serine/threonine-protein kinase